MIAINREPITSFAQLTLGAFLSNEDRIVTSRQEEKDHPAATAIVLLDQSAIKEVCPVINQHLPSVRSHQATKNFELTGREPIGEIMTRLEDLDFPFIYFSTSVFNVEVRACVVVNTASCHKLKAALLPHHLEIRV